MPHLDANALQNDPEGLAFLRCALGPSAGRRRPAGFKEVSGRDLPEAAPLPSAARRAPPTQLARPVLTPHHAREA